MNTQTTTERLSPRQWWWARITEFNKGLTMSGFVALIIYCAIGAMVVNPVKEYMFVIAAVAIFIAVYIIYTTIAFALYALGWLIDSALNDNSHESFRIMLFTCIYWIAVAVPILVMLYLVYLFTAPHNSLL